jgi:hypothetical protein
LDSSELSRLKMSRLNTRVLIFLCFVKANELS